MKFKAKIPKMRKNTSKEVPSSNLNSPLPKDLKKQENIKIKEKRHQKMRKRLSGKDDVSSISSSSFEEKKDMICDDLGFKKF